MTRQRRHSRRTLAVHLLGGFEVAVGDDSVPDDAWQRRHAKSLLKLLALAPRYRVHREVLMERLWPDAAPDLAANNLNKAIHAARRALEPGLTRGVDSAFVVTGDQHVRLEGPEGLEVDVAAFERAAAAALEPGADAAQCEAALARYGGELLPDDRYDEWLDAPRDALRRLRRRVAERLVDLLEARGDACAAVAPLEALVADEPLDELAARRLMRALAAAGRRDRALRVYERLAASLDAELGAAPDAATRAVRDELARAADAAQSGPARRTNLPRRGTRFVGREADLEEVERLLDAHELVTLVGPGGVGKTRLATQAASACSDDFPGGVWLVALAPVANGGMVGAAAASALGIADGPYESPAAAIVATIAEPALLVLDNCEHVADAAASLAGELLGATDRIRILATGREPLGLEGEVVVRVATLGVPSVDEAGEPGALDRFDATRLFVDRVRLLVPGFDPRGKDADRAAEICRRLDGLPLAVELAAASAATLGVAKTAERLDDVLELEPPRVTEPRHRSLRAVMAWSYELLDEPERRALERLSVFAGGFSLDAAEAVCGPGARAAVERLARASLVAPAARGDEAGFAMLETVRAFAAERLAARGDAEDARRAHASYIADLAESVEPELTGIGQRFAVARLDAERENLWAAIQWALDHPAGDGVVAQRTCGAVWLWLQRTDLRTARAWLERALAAGPDAPSAARARVLHGLGSVRRQQGEFAESTELVERSVETWRALGDETGTARALQTLAGMLGEAGDYARGEAANREAAEICRRTEDVVGYARSANWLGVHAIHVGELDEARRWLDEALALYRCAGAEANAMVMVHNLGEVALLEGDLETADRLAVESLEASRRLGETIVAPHSIRLRADVAARRGDRVGALGLLRQAADMHAAIGDRPGLVAALESAGAAAALAGDAETALRIAGAAETARERFGMHTHPFERRVIDGWTARARAAVAPGEAVHAVDRGRATPLEAALALALGG